MPHLTLTWGGAVDVRCTVPDVYPNPNVGANIKGGFDVLVVTKDGGQKSSDSQYVLDILLCLAWFGSYQNNIATCQTKKNKAVHNNNYYESGNN